MEAGGDFETAVVFETAGVFEAGVVFEEDVGLPRENSAGLGRPEGRPLLEA